MANRLALLLVLVTTACKGVNSEQDAARAYLGLDAGITRAVNLGLDGYNAASSANIDPQVADGDLAGTMTVSGQVDQGSSDNKELRLEVALDGYLDDTIDGDVEFAVIYDTNPDAPPSLDVSLRGIPDGTLEGTLVGDFAMSEDLAGVVTLDLAIAGEIEPGVDGVGVAQTAGSTHVTGTATSDFGTYDVDLTR
jgi:hypothetical protein